LIVDRPELRVLALVPYPLRRVPGQRYRIEQWEPHLRRAGVEVEFRPFLCDDVMPFLYEHGHWLRKARATRDGYRSRLRDLHREASYDAAYVFREAALFGPAWIEGRVAKRWPVVFDFDDAIYLPDSSPANSFVRFLKSPSKTDSICRVATEVMAGNPTLAAYAERRSSRVTIVPSTIDTDSYRPLPRSARQPLVIGWTGSQTTLKHLEPLVPLLVSLRRSVDFRLRVIGGILRGAEGLEVENIRWSAEREVEDLRILDIGLMPLPDDEWSRGKCGMKALQYMGLGIPPVVSPVGANATIVEDGVSGFHARTPGEWIDRLRRLLGDAELRARVGAAGRARVEAEFSAVAQAPRVAAIFQRAAGRLSPTVERS